ncbi:MAG: DUF1697 domain-containing protein [Anaerolineae bacterium]|nr:DUF1697 domain-containing protein [Anaerolineae bacterium]
MPVYIALLRAVNVGKRKMLMQDLRDLLEAQGFEAVQTLLQSGNAVFISDQTDRKQLIQQIESAIEAQFGYYSEVILRSTDEIRAVIENNPFAADRELDPRKLLVMYLTGKPDADAIQTLMDAHDGPEELHVVGHELYIYFPDGMGRSKLSTAFTEKKIKTAGTGRNWKTTLKLLELAESIR